MLSGVGIPFLGFTRYLVCMKLVCSQAALNTALQLVSRAVATRPTHPVLANVLLTADGGTNRLSLTGFDLNLGIQTAIEASVDISGAITLPSRLLGEIVSRLDSESSLTLFSDDKGENVELKSLGGSYQMRGMSADDFPNLPLVETGTSLKLHANSLLKALRSTLFSSSSDEVKQLLTGVHLKFDGKSMEAAATDGHRLAVLKTLDALEDEVDDSEFSQDNDLFEVTLPSRSLREVERFLSTLNSNDLISLFCDRGQVVLLSSDQVITSRTLEGDYPNYNQLIPDQFERKVTLERKDFITSLERVAVLADQHNNIIKIVIESQSSSIKILADAQDVGSGSESLTVEISGEPIEIAFNVRYVLEGLKSIDSQKVCLQFNAPNTPAIIVPVDSKDDFTYLVMPVQIRS